MFSKLCTYLLISLSAFFMPIVWAFFVVSLFVAVDTITGVMVAGKDSIKNIRSKKLFNLVPKLIIYLLLVVVAQACTYIDNQIPFVKLVMIGIGLIEIKSIDENFFKLFGFSFIDKVIEGIKSLSKFKRK